MKALKMLLMTIVLSLSLFATSYSQTFDFCQNVDKSNGTPIGSYTAFSCNSSSCYCYGLLNLGYNVTDDYIIYDVYKVNSYGNETYYTSYTISSGGQEWSWAFAKMTFSSSGTYYVYIYTKYTSTSSKVYIGKAAVQWQF